MPPRKRKRNFAAEYRRRNELAREQGYKDYYDYRAHGYGKRAPSEARLTGAELRRARGHASGSDLDRLLKTGRVEVLHIFMKKEIPPRFEIVAVEENGDERTFYIQGKPLDRVRATIADLGPDVPTLVGSPKTIKTFEESEEELAEAA